MTAIHRCAVGIGPRQPLIDWIRQVSGDRDVRWGANEDGLYLLPEYEDDIEAKEVLEESYEPLRQSCSPGAEIQHYGLAREPLHCFGNGSRSASTTWWTTSAVKS